MRWLVAAATAPVIVVVALVAGGSASRHLPRPPVIPANAQTSAHAQQNQQLFSNSAAVPLTGCTVRSSAGGLLAGRPGQVVTVQSAPGAWVRLNARYSRFASVHSGQANNQGTLVFELADPPTVNAQTVHLTATATLQKVQKTCQSEFTPQPPKLLCSVSVSNPAPGPGVTTEAVAVRTSPGASVRLSAIYPRFTSVHRRQAASGTAYFYLQVTNPIPGFRVVVTATASLWSAAAYCQTSFTRP